MNDLPECIDKDSYAYLFADDTKVFRNISGPDDITKLQKDIECLVQWSNTWMLKFHPNKCVSMSMGSKTFNTYSMEDHNLDISNCEIDLGVYINDKLNFERHITAAVNKANKIMAVVRKTFEYLDEQTFCYIFKGLVRPHLEYGAPIWNPHKIKLKEIIEKVQRRATKSVPGLKDLSYEERLKRLKLPTLAYRRMRGDMITVFKLLNKGYDVSLPSILTPNKTVSGDTMISC